MPVSSKILAIGAFVLFLFGKLDTYLLSYLWGWFTEPSILGFYAEIAAVLVSIIASPLLIITAWIRDALYLRSFWWSTGAVIAFFVLYIGSFHLILPPGFMMVYGNRDRIMGQYSADDLRAFAREIRQKMPGFHISRKYLDRLTPDQLEIYEGLEKKYTFLDYGDGPNVEDIDGDVVEVSWGSALPGLFGFRVLNKPDRSAKLDRFPLWVSDDIYFFPEP